MKLLGHAAAAAVIPIAAATTLVVRDGAGGPEVLMVRRSMQAIFMPGAYVFPGGAVDPVDGSPASERMCDESAAALVRRIGTVTQVGDAALGSMRLRHCANVSKNAVCGSVLRLPRRYAGAICVRS